MARKKTTTKKTTTSKSAPVSTPTCGHDQELAKYAELKSLSTAFVNEIDNIMSSGLQPDHLGQVLGTVVRSFKDRLQSID